MPLLDVLQSIFVFFLLFAWVWVVVRVISDVFLSRDLGGFAKGLWVLFIIIIPWLGVLSYLVVRGRGMEDRSHVQGGSIPSTADELSKLADLRDKGVITDDEFETQKARLLR